MQLGFIGTGTIAAALVEGLSRGPNPPPILVSPRSETVSRRLAGQFPNVRRAASNAEVATADIIILAIRPAQVEDALAGIALLPDQIIVSLVAGLPLAELQVLAPGAKIVRSVPLPGAARGIGPLPIFPGDPVIEKLFAPLGDLFVVPSETALYAGGLSAFMSSYFELQNAFISMAFSGGLRPEMARDYVVSLMSMLADTSRVTPPESFDHLVGEHQTKGGMNEQVRDQLLKAGWFAAATAAMDRVTRLKRSELD